MTPFNPGACLCDPTVLPRGSCLLGPVKFELDNRIANWDFGAVLTLAEPPKCSVFRGSMKCCSAPGWKEMIRCHQSSCPDGKQILTITIPSVLVTFLMSEECSAFIVGAGGAHGWWSMVKEGGMGGQPACVYFLPTAYFLCNSDNLLNPSQSPFPCLLNGDNEFLRGQVRQCTWKNLEYSLMDIDHTWNLLGP